MITAMKFRKGTKVEVLGRTLVPPGSWRCAQIICGNGHNYTVRYECGLDAEEGQVERVSRKVIRPCPPDLEVSDNLVSGDVVEVFNNFCWKMATVQKILGRKYILVRLLGSSAEFKVKKSDIRLRQLWQNNEWVVIGKDCAGCEDTEYQLSTPRYNQNVSCQVHTTNKGTSHLAKDNHVLFRNEVDHNGSLVASKTLKRGRYCETEDYAEAGKKLRAVQKDGKWSQLVLENPSKHDQVDAVAFGRDRDEKVMCVSVNNKTTGLSEVDLERRKPPGTFGCSFAENLVSRDADSVTCSVGSCSVSSENFYKVPHHVSTGPVEDTDQYSDAESICHLRDEDENCLPTKEELAAEVHRLELHAYRCTMEALHASGPLTWDQEELVTNLRLSLHISNDEHLMQLRNLISR